MVVELLACVATGVCGAKLLVKCISEAPGAIAFNNGLAPRIKERVLGSKLSGAQDIHTLLLCPDPTRAYGNTYKTLSELGKGSFGAVFRVRYLPTGEERAIKVVRKPADPQQFNYLVSEAEALIKLDHENIAKLYEYFEEPKRVFLVTELCPDGNLGHLDLAQDDLEEVKLLYRDVLSAIAYCHSEGVVHRDLKFENCLLKDSAARRRRVAKVIDFGLAAIRRRHTKKDHWISEEVGTLYFTAPEVLNSTGWSKYGSECDVWSIGVMLHITLTEAHPLVDPWMSGKADIVRLVGQGAIRQWPLQECGVDKLAKDLVSHMLVKRPRRRLTARAALEHPWFKESVAQSHVSTSSSAKPGESQLLPSRTPRVSLPHLKSMLRRIRTFSSYSRFERAIFTLVAHNSFVHDVQDLRAAFVSLDPDHMGYLSREDFRQAIAERGIELSAEDLQELVEALDPDRDDKIRYTDWLAATLRPSALTSDRAMREAFDFFDLHGEGKVRRSDLFEVFGEELGSIPTAKAENPCHELGDDDDLSWKEFAELLRGTASRLDALAVEERAGPRWLA